MARISRQENHPTIRFFIEVRDKASGVLLEEYSVDQCCKMDSTSIQQTENVMARHCDVMYRKTGLVYQIIEWSAISEFFPELPI